MFIVAPSRYWGRLDDDRPRRALWEKCGQVDHQRDSAIVAPLMNRAQGTPPTRHLDARPRFLRADHMRLSGRIIALIPLDLAGEHRVGELSLDDDADLGAGVVVNRKHCSRHDRDPAEGQLGIIDGDRYGTAEDLARDGCRCGGFRSRLLGERNWRG